VTAPAPSLPQRRAVIDVGTNSVKLLVGDVTGRSVTAVAEDSEQTRLGRGFYETQRLQAEAIGETAACVARFSQVAAGLGARHIRVLATSAAREARNADELVEAIREQSGHAVEIISGPEEADLAFRGVVTDDAISSTAVLIMDVGGGSTEFILGQDGRKTFSRSFPIGTVRLLEKFPQADPPPTGALDPARAWLQNFFRSEITPGLRQAWPATADVLLIGTGGTTTLMARIELGVESYERDLLERAPFNRRQVSAQLARLAALPLTDRRAVPGLPAKRADVIIFGLLIFDVAMAELGLEQLRVSTRGLRFAAILPTAGILTGETPPAC
jgi:exopolyphosphatase/guanosine-5'-triphosphate,3'-diphosphate pyrophosphatase